MSLTLLSPLYPTPAPLGKCACGAYVLPYYPMNGPLPAELQFRENTAISM